MRPGLPRGLRYGPGTSTEMGLRRPISGGVPVRRHWPVSEDGLSRPNPRTRTGGARGPVTLDTARSRGQIVVTHAEREASQLLGIRRRKQNPLRRRQNGRLRRLRYAREELGRPMPMAELRSSMPRRARCAARMGRACGGESGNRRARESQAPSGDPRGRGVGQRRDEGECEQRASRVPLLRVGMRCGARDNRSSNSPPWTTPHHTRSTVSGCRQPRRTPLSPSEAWRQPALGHGRRCRHGRHRQ